MKIKWKIVLSLSLLMITIVASIDIIVGFKVSNLITVKTSKELVNYSELGITLLDNNYPGDWSLNGDKLYKGDTLINGNYDVVDKISKGTGLLATIFAGETRISTTVTDQNGNRIIATKASAEIVTKVLHNGLSFKGITQVEGKDTEAYYVPLRDKDNNIVGMLFVGIYNSSIQKDVSDTMKEISILLLFIAFIGFIISYFLGSYMSKGYRVLEKDMAKVADGDFNIRFHNKSLNRKDEIGDIVRSFYNKYAKQNKRDHHLYSNRN